jgi:hypothetical protein
MLTTWQPFCYGQSVTEEKSRFKDAVADKTDMEDGEDSLFGRRESRGNSSGRTLSLVQQSTVSLPVLATRLRSYSIY